MHNIKQLIISNLSSDLLSSKYKNKSKNKLFGHCYIASEVAYYILGGKVKGWAPQYIKHEGYSHWYLKHMSGEILDITASQFKKLPDYSKGIGKGFLTKAPSKRAMILIKRTID